MQIKSRSYGTSDPKNGCCEACAFGDRYKHTCKKAATAKPSKGVRELTSRANREFGQEFTR